MKQSIRLVRIGGVPIGVHWSVACIFALVTWELATTAFPDAYGAGSHPAYWVAAAVAATLFLVSLLAHEGSHAVAARRHGVGVRSITLWLFGGVAQLESEARSPGADFTIAAVGPGMSVALAGAFAAAQLLLERAGSHGLVVGVCSWLWQINLLLAGFNLIPAAPLDGGRILRAGLWKATGNRARASMMAARAGSGFGIVLIGLGLFEFATGSPIGLWSAVLGWFLLGAARAEGAAAMTVGAVDHNPVGSIMVLHPPVVASAMTVAEFLAGPVQGWQDREVGAVVGPTGWLEGVVTLASVAAVPSGARTTTRLGDVAERIEAIPVGRPEEPLSVLLGQMDAVGARSAVVLDPANRLAGIITFDDVARAQRRSEHATAPVG
ncbi:MAG TPA: site-2 protease family protein [Acidimicrobiales bacterium]